MLSNKRRTSTNKLLSNKKRSLVTKLLERQSSCYSLGNIRSAASTARQEILPRVGGGEEGMTTTRAASRRPILVQGSKVNNDVLYLAKDTKPTVGKIPQTDRQVQLSPVSASSRAPLKT